ncbi:MAG: TonB-dependent receptor [Bacteroidia bacterium]|nr:TonB-dependent receptor [Bacteroidia bacterium]
MDKVFLYRINKIHAVIWIVYVLLPLNLKAQTDSLKAQTEAKKFDLDELVVTGQYGENTLTKSVYKVKVIDAGRIKLQGAFNLQQLLVNELNVRISQDPILGSSVQLQGVGGNNIKILIDGVPVIGRENGSIDLTQINLNNVERIELIEGPMSVNFGTDALGGVINIITKKQKKESINTKENVYYESIGQYNADASVGLSNLKYNLLVNAGRNFFQGYSTNPDSRTKLWKPRTQYMADLILGKYTLKGNLRWSNQFFTEKVTDKGEPTVDWTRAVATDRYYINSRFTSSFFFDKKYKDKRHMNVVASYNFYERRQNSYQINLVDMSKELIPSVDNQDTNRFHLIMSRGTYASAVLLKKISYQIGYEVNHEFVVGRRIEGNMQQIGDYSLFGSTEIKALPRLLIRPGMRITYNTRFSVPVIPSLNLKVDITENWTIRSSYARGFRAPSLKELSLKFVDISHNIKGNENLKPETSDNFQINIMYQNKTAKRVWRFEPSLFYNHIKSMIDLKRTGSGDNAGYQYFNINEFSSAGMNVNCEYNNGNYQIIVGYARTGRQNNLLQNSGSSPYFFSDEWRLNLAYNFIKYDASVNLFLKHNGKIQTYQYNYLTDGVMLSYIDPFSLMDMSVSKNFWNKKIALTIGSKNILNVINVNASFNSGAHSSMNNFAMTGLGRTWFVGLRYSI